MIAKFGNVPMLRFSLTLVCHSPPNLTLKNACFITIAICGGFDPKWRRMTGLLIWFMNEKLFNVYSLS